MPLVAPGINSPDGGSTAQNWMQKLAGKKLVDGGKSDDSSFAKGELPKGSRVLSDDSMMTMDHNPDRLNVHVDKDGVVKKVTSG